MALEFLPQCCDAHQYLDFAHICATTGRCYQDLRPMGAQYWFSWPARLGLPTASLIVAHGVLLAVSVLLSVAALGRWLRLAGRGPGIAGHAVLVLASALAHTVLFWPVLQVSLADAPAGLLALAGAWLLLLAQGRTRYRWLWFGAAGLLWGLAAWIRIFYLYPVLAVLGLHLLLWLLWRPRRLGELVLLLALLPLAIQYAATWRHHQAFGYIAPVMAAGWSQLHLTDPAAGYDTILPRQPYRWAPPCGSGEGILDAWQAGDWRRVGCVFAGRFNFYFGSYSATTYPYFGTINLLDTEFTEEIGHPNAWGLAGLRWEPDQAEAPHALHSHTADRLVTTAPPGEGDRVVFQWVPAKAGIPYTFSIWLWGPEPHTLDLVLYQYPENTEVARTVVAITDAPQRVAMTASPLNDGMFGVMIGATAGSEASFGRAAQAAFLAWGAKLEESPVMTVYKEPVREEALRTWSWWILAGNSLALLAVPLVGIALRRGTGRPGVLVVLFAGLLLGQALFVVPEQRFVVALQVFAWLALVTLCLAGRRQAGR